MNNVCIVSRDLVCHTLHIWHTFSNIVCLTTATCLKYTDDVSLLLKKLIRKYESTVIFHTGPGEGGGVHSDYYAGFTMTLHA